MATVDCKEQRRHYEDATIGGRDTFSFDECGWMDGLPMPTPAPTPAKPASKHGRSRKDKAATQLDAQ